MKNVLVLGGTYNSSFLPSSHFNSVGMNSYTFPTAEASDLDLILFTGGGDLCPEMYGKSYPEISGSPFRDKWESAWFKFAVKHNIAMFGICRGMQLFTALTGGELIPHIENHFGQHFVRTLEKRRFVVNSIHHQMCVPQQSDIQMLAWAENVAFTNESEPEALWFPKIRALGVQWHPESMENHTEANKFVLNKINTLLFPEGV